MNSLDKGKIGEDQALTYLQALGYKLYARNVRIGRDEIDLIFYDPSEKCLVFVEVKSRSRFDPNFLPELGITFKKRERIFRSADAWVNQQNYEGSFRIDVIFVIENCVTDHIKEITRP